MTPKPESSWLLGATRRLLLMRGFDLKPTLILVMFVLLRASFTRVETTCMNHSAAVDKGVYQFRHKYLQFSYLLVRKVSSTATKTHGMNKGACIPTPGKDKLAICKWPGAMRQSLTICA